MTDPSMDSFDARLTNLMTAYGDRAVATYDAAAIARAATARDTSRRDRLGLTLNLGRGTRLLLLAAAVALLALAASVMAAGSRPQLTPPGTIVLGPDGPEQTAYRVPQGPPFELTIENRSDVTWVPWTGLAEKDSWCHQVSGQALPNPCTVGPHSTIVLRPPSVATGPTEIHFAPPGLDWQKGFLVIVDVVAQP